MSKMISIAKRTGRLSEPLRYWILKASSILDGAVSDVSTLQTEVAALLSQITTTLTGISIAGSLSYGGGRVFTHEPVAVTGPTPSTFVAPANSFVANKSHVVVAIR